MGRNMRAVSADEEAPLLPKVTDVPVDSDMKAAARQLNKLMIVVVCCTFLAVIAWGHNEFLKSQDPVNRIVDLRRRIAKAEHQLAYGSVMHGCRDGSCAKDFLPPIARGAADGTNLTDEAESYVLPASWNVLLDPEQSYWFWIILFLFFCSALLLTGALLEATSRKSKGEGWFKVKARELFTSVRRADTFKQLCFYNPYVDADQEPGEGNAYRLIAIVGPNCCKILNEGRDNTGRDMSCGGYEFTLPTKAGYFIMLCVTGCLLTMQIYFPWQLITELLGSGSHYQLVGLKRVAYYVDFPERVWLQLVPLLLMSCKFFVVVERTLRNEFNQCLWLYHTAAEGKFRYCIFGKYWSFFWITVSLVINFYIGIIMTLYVVVNIAIFDSQGGNLMDFILGIFGSFGLINFDDSIMEALPQWSCWYKAHCTIAGHPQGEHPDGESVDEFFGPEGVKETGEGHDVMRWGEESQAEGDKGSLSDAARPMKTKFVRVGFQLSPERQYLGFYYNGTKITKVADDGAAAWAVDLDELKNGVYRHVDLLFEVEAGWTESEIGLTFKSGSLVVEDASGKAFNAGVRPGYKLVEANGQHVKKNDQKEKERVLKTGGTLRFHEKSQIYEPFGHEQGTHQWQPIGDAERGPYLYKGKDASEMGYWEYQNDKVRKQDESDGHILPTLAWPPSTAALKVFWEKAVKKWKNGRAKAITLKSQKAASFQTTFGVALDRDSNGLLQVIAIVQGSIADQQKLSTGMGYYAHEFKKGDHTLWKAPGKYHELVTQFSALERGEDISLSFKPMSVLKKPTSSGIEPGMIIYKINGEVVQDGADVRRVLRRLKGDSMSYPACEFDEDKYGDAPVNWTGGTLNSRDEQGQNLINNPEKGVVKEFTMTLSRAADDTAVIDDVVHGVIYALVRILLFSSLVFILATYYVDTQTGHHVGI